MNTEIDEVNEPGLKYLRLAGWSAALCLFLLPLVAMQFTDEVQWTLSDFVFAALLIGGIGLAAEFAVRKSRDLTYRLGFAVTLGATCLLVWINAAVGIIGAEDNDANALYWLVLLIGIGLGAAGGFSPGAMAKAAAAAALAQTLLTAVAIVAGLGLPASSALELLAVNGFFVAAWLLAAVLFHMAKRTGAGDPASAPRKA